jgi:pimeloyl-ACP methyl ester carboxylesterase
MTHEMNTASIATLPGVTAERVVTSRLGTRVLFAGPDSGDPVLFLHGNLSSATWWEEVLVSLPAEFRAIAPDQRGFGDADADAHIDATRGMGDLAGDAIALLDHLGIERAHLVGSSMGGSVVWRLIMEHAPRILTAVQVAPGSPYGFGGTRDAEGTPCHDDFAGSGAGLSNPGLVARIRTGDVGADHPMAPRRALRLAVMKPGFVAAREDALVMAMLAVHLGERDFPGDVEPSPNWPHVAPGRWGVNNALSPRHAGDVAALYRAVPRPDILWIRGSDDVVVSDCAAGDPGTWGPGGLVPGYPGSEVYPPQPMIAQTRAVLDRYAAAGGRYREVVLDGAGHAPYLDSLDAFNAALHRHLAARRS